jgi:hypothetical protein
MFAFRILAMFAVAAAAVVSAQMGGAQPVDVHDNDVIIAARFAMDNAYKEHAENYKIVRATRQIVNGQKYELTVEITEPSSCIVRQFGVWNRAGPPGRFLVENEILDVPCGSNLRA